MPAGAESKYNCASRDLLPVNVIFLTIKKKAVYDRLIHLTNDDIFSSSVFSRTIKNNVMKKSEWPSSKWKKLQIALQKINKTTGSQALRNKQRQSRGRRVGERSRLTSLADSFLPASPLPVPQCMRACSQTKLSFEYSRTNASSKVNYAGSKRVKTLLLHSQRKPCYFDCSKTHHV